MLSPAMRAFWPALPPWPATTACKTARPCRGQTRAGTASCNDVLIQLFLWFFAKLVNDVEEHVVGQHVAPHLGASLGVHRHAAVAQLVQHVEPVDQEGEAQLSERLRQAGVPHHIVGVGTAVVIATAAVDRQVGGKLHLPGQGGLEGGAIVEVPHALGLEALAAA